MKRQRNDGYYPLAPVLRGEGKIAMLNQEPVTVWERRTIAEYSDATARRSVASGYELSKIDHCFWRLQLNGMNRQTHLCGNFLRHRSNAIVVL